MALNIEFEDSAARERVVISDVNAPLINIVTEVCTRRGLEARLYGLRHGRTMVELSRSFALSGISANATVTLVRATAASAGGALVKVVLVLPDGSRCEQELPNSTLLSDVAAACVPSRAAALADSKCAGVTVVYVRTAVIGAALTNTTLAAIGATKGTIMLRAVLPASLEAAAVDAPIAVDAPAPAAAEPEPEPAPAPAPVELPSVAAAPTAAASSEVDMSEPAAVPVDRPTRVATPATATARAQRGLAAMRAAAFDADTGEAIRTLLRILDNVLSNPGESKYRSLRMGNATFFASVGRHPGALQVLAAVGFQMSGTMPEDQVMTLRFEREDDDITLAVRRVLAATAQELHVETPPEPDVDIASRKTAMATASAAVASSFDPFKASVMKIGASDTGVTLEHKTLASDGLTLTERKLNDIRNRSRAIQEQMRPKQRFTWIAAVLGGSGAASAVSAAGDAAGDAAASRVEATEDDMEVDDPDTARLLLEFARKKIAEMSGEQTFRTAAQRELEVRKGAAVYTTCIIRVQLPDRTIVHGTFSPLDMVASVHEWVLSLLRDEWRAAPFCLYAAPPPRVIVPGPESLEEAGLSPAVLLYFTWGSSLADAAALRSSMPLTADNILSSAALAEYSSTPSDASWSANPIAVDADSWFASPAATAPASSAPGVRVAAAARGGAAPSEADIDAMATMLLGGGGGAAPAAGAAAGRGKAGGKPSWLRV